MADADTNNSRYTHVTYKTDWALSEGQLVDPNDGEPLTGERLTQTLQSYNMFSMLKTGRSVLSDPRDLAFADSILAMWRAEGYE